MLCCIKPPDIARIQHMIIFLEQILVSKLIIAFPLSTFSDLLGKFIDVALEIIGDRVIGVSMSLVDCIA